MMKEGLNGSGVNDGDVESTGSDSGSVSETRPLLAATVAGAPFSKKVFTERVRKTLETISCRPFYVPEWWDRKKKIMMLLGLLPVVIAGAAIIYPALIQQDADKKSHQSDGDEAWTGIQTGVAFTVNYPQYFIPIDLVLRGTIAEYVRFFQECYRTNTWGANILSFYFLVGMVGRTIFSAVMGYFTSGLWPSVAKQVAWLANAFFEYGFLYPASVCIQVVGLDRAYRAAMNYVPAFSDSMYVAGLQRRIHEQYLNHHDACYATHAAKSAEERPSDLDAMQKGSKAYYYPVITFIMKLLLAVSGFSLFAISNLGNAKETALNDSITDQERLLSIVSTYSFGVFGAMVFALLEPLFVAAVASRFALLKQHWDKVLLSLICVGISAMSALPSEITFEEAFSAAGNSTLPHHVNFQSDTYSDLKNTTFVGSTYANWLWLSLFLIPIYIKIKKFYDEFTIRHRVVKEEFSALPDVHKTQLVQECADSNEELAAALNQKNAPALNGSKATDFLRECKAGKPANELREKADYYGKSRQWAATIISAVTASVMASLRYSGVSSFYALVPQLLLSEIGGFLMHRFFDYKHQQATTVVLPENNGFSPMYEKAEPADVTRGDKVIEFGKVIFASAAPLASYWLAKAVVKWAAQYVFELSHEQAEHSSKVWANAITVAGSFAVSQARQFVKPGLEAAFTVPKATR